MKIIKSSVIEEKQCHGLSRASLLNYVPYVPCAAGALVPNCLVPYAPRALHALVSHLPRALRALVPYVPRALRALVPHAPCALRALVS